MGEEDTEELEELDDAAEEAVDDDVADADDVANEDDGGEEFDGPDDGGDYDSYESQAAEEGGFGLPADDAAGSFSRYYNPSYDPDTDSKELLDTDAQSDFSSDFTGGDGSNEFNDQFGGNEGGDDAENDGDSGGRRRSSAVVMQGDDDAADADDGGEDSDDPDDNGDDNNEDDEEGAAKKQLVAVTGAQGQGKDDDQWNGAIKWKPGQPITFSLLDQVWHKCKRIDKVRPMCKALNDALEIALKPMPNLSLRFFNWTERFGDANMDTVDCLLALAKRNGKRTAFFLPATIETALTFNPLPITFFAGFNEATLQAALLLPGVKEIVTPLFTAAVPLINKMDKDKKK